MKKVFFGILMLATIATSCKKSNSSSASTPLTISKSDFGLNFKVGGASIVNANIDIANSLISPPVSGENQNWDASHYSTLNTYTISPYISSTTNTTFPSSTYGYSFFSTYGFGSLSSQGTTSIQYFEVSGAGWFNLGNSTSDSDVLSIPSINGTLTYPAQNRAYSQKVPQVNFPLKFGDDVKLNGIIATTSFIANAPSMNINNTPSQVVTTDSVENKLIASGNITLTSIGKVRVLINMQTVSSRINYFLGGAPAPTQLLTSFGLVDGAITKTISFDYYAEGLGRVGRMFTDASGTVVTSAFFRVQ